jgi:hypothetical protein
MMRLTERGAWPRYARGAARSLAPAPFGATPNKLSSRFVAIIPSRRTFPPTGGMHRPPAGLERGSA